MRKNSPLLSGPGKIHGFILVENPTDKERLLLKHQIPVSCTRNLTFIACGRWRPVTN